MQEAFKVVSSPRWQNPATDEKPAVPQNSSDADSARSEVKADTEHANSDKPTASAQTRDESIAEADQPELPYTGDDTTASAEPTDSDSTRTDIADPEAIAGHEQSVARAYEPPTVLETARSPLLAITAACAAVAALWSYTSLEDVRSQLASVSTAKASLERSLADTQSKLAVAEKTVTDIKAAIAAAAAPAKASGSPAAK